MGQLEINDRSLPDFEIVKQLYDISDRRNINKIIEQNESIIVTFDDDISKFTGKNRNIVIIPDVLYIKEKNEIYITRNIEIPLSLFPEVLEIVVNKFPHIDKFITDEKVFSINIKPCIKVSKNNCHRLEEELNDYHKAIGFLDNPENQQYLSTYVLAEIIRKLYRGEHDLMNGFLILRSTFKYIKAVVDEKTPINLLIEKLDENPNVVDVDNFFFGADGKYYLKILDNIIFYTPKKTTYLNFLDLKYLSILDVLGNLLNQKKFGRD